MGRKTQKPKRPSSQRATVSPTETASNAGSEASGETSSDGNLTALRISFAWKLAIVAGIALVVRLVHVLMTSSVPTATSLLGDAAGYYAWAEKISAGNWYGDETFYQAPLYPYFLAVLLKFGLGIPGIRVAQAILGAAGVALLGTAARKHFSERIAITAATMLALYPASIFYDGVIQKASLASFLLCALLAAISRLQGSWRVANAILIGFLLALLVITRENALLWIPLLGIWVLYESKPGQIWGNWRDVWRTRLTFAAAYVAGLAIVLLPIAARNASLGGEWSPTTFQAGPNFYIGNNLSADGIYRPLVPGHETPVYERSDAVMIAESSTGRTMTSREVSSFWMNRSWQEIRENPAHWVQLMIQKSFMVINWFEVPDVESMSVYRQQSVPLKLSWLWNFGVLFSLSMIGIWFSYPRWREFWLDYALLAIMLAAIVLFFILGRYRLPLVPLLLPFAALGLITLWDRIRHRDERRGLSRPLLIGPLLIGLVSAIVCFLPVHDVAGLTASSQMNNGIAAAKQGKTDLAIQLLRQSVQQQPDFAETHYNLGQALLQARQPNQAVVALRNAIQLEPQLPMADLLLGKTLESLGRTDDARFHYQRATQFPSNRTEASQALRRLDF